MPITQARLLTILEAAEHFEQHFSTLHQACLAHPDLHSLALSLYPDTAHAQAIASERARLNPARLHSNNLAAARAEAVRRARGAKPRQPTLTTPHSRNFTLPPPPDYSSPEWQALEREVQDELAKPEEPTEL